jgi:tRNA dimethylallyltransferase
MGPTGSGKTDAALSLAAHYPCEIVSVDSAQVYRGLDIGTAKPDPGQRRAVPHHLIDLCDPADAYSAARFAEDALRVVAAIRARGRIPLLVGGTGLYFRALEEGLSPMPSADPALRARLQAELSERGSAVLHAQLQAVDPAAAARIHPNDPQRILRALEVYLTVGVPISALQATKPIAPLTGCIHWILAPASRPELHARLASRFAVMLERGLINEVAGLRARGDLDLDRPAMRAVGYRAVWRFLEGELGRPAMVDEAVAATRQLAKRQFTWFRRVENAVWWDSAAPDLHSRLQLALGACTPRGL